MTGSYVPRVRPMSRAQIEADANAVIRRHYPKLLQKPGPFPVLDFFDLLRDKYDLDPGVEQLSDGIEGMTFPDGRVIVSEETYRSAYDGVGRARFTVPHECYHGIQHRAQIRKALVDSGELVLYRRQTVKPYEDPEWQANTFAAAVLMPDEMVRRVCSKQNSLIILPTMCDEFGVSVQAAEVRLKKLGLI